MTYPRGAGEILQAKKLGRDIDPVVIVFDGKETHVTGSHHVFPVEGRAYDWGFLSGLQAFVVVRKGIDAEAVIRSVAAICEPYLGVVDIDRQRVAYVVENGNLWHMRKGGADWLEWFS